MTGQEIKELRRAANITQKELSERAEINVNQIQKLERGEIIPGNMTARNLIAIADALGVDPHLLIK